MGSAAFDIKGYRLKESYVIKYLIKVVEISEKVFLIISYSYEY